MRKALLPVDGSETAFQVAHQSHVGFDNVAAGIVAMVDARGCDAIIMGTRGPGALAGLAFGSVTGKVLPLVKVPVVCIKSAPPNRVDADSLPASVPGESAA